MKLIGNRIFSWIDMTHANVKQLNWSNINNNATKLIQRSVVSRKNKNAYLAIYTFLKSIS